MRLPTWCLPTKVPGHTVLNTAAASCLGAGLCSRIPITELGSQAHYSVPVDLPIRWDSQEAIQWTTDASEGSEEVPRTYIQILHPPRGSAALF